MCACMCLCHNGHVCVYTCICVPVRAHRHVCIPICFGNALCAPVSHASTYTLWCVGVCIHTPHRHSCVCITYICVYMFAYVCICICVHSCICVQMCFFVWVWPGALGPATHEPCFSGDYSRPLATFPTATQLRHHPQPSALGSASHVVPKSHGEQLCGASVFE